MDSVQDQTEQDEREEAESRVAFLPMMGGVPGVMGIGKKKKKKTKGMSTAKKVIYALLAVVILLALGFGLWKVRQQQKQAAMMPSMTPYMPADYNPTVFQ